MDPISPSCPPQVHKGTPPPTNSIRRITRRVRRILSRRGKIPHTHERALEPSTALEVRPCPSSSFVRSLGLTQVIVKTNEKDEIDFLDLAPNAAHLHDLPVLPLTGQASPQHCHSPGPLTTTQVVTQPILDQRVANAQTLDQTANQGSMDPPVYTRNDFPPPTHSFADLPGLLVTSIEDCFFYSHPPPQRLHRLVCTPDARQLTHGQSRDQSEAQKIDTTATSQITDRTGCDGVMPYDGALPVSIHYITPPPEPQHSIEVKELRTDTNSDISQLVDYVRHFVFPWSGEANTSSPPSSPDETRSATPRPLNFIDVTLRQDTGHTPTPNTSPGDGARASSAAQVAQDKEDSENTTRTTECAVVRTLKVSSHLYPDHPSPDADIDNPHAWDIISSRPSQRSPWKTSTTAWTMLRRQLRLRPRTRVKGLRLLSVPLLRQRGAALGPRNAHNPRPPSILGVQ